MSKSIQKEIVFRSVEEIRDKVKDYDQIRETIKQEVLSELELGTVGSSDFDADHISDSIAPYVAKLLLQERQRTLEEVENELFKVPDAVIDAEYVSKVVSNFINKGNE